MEAHGRQPYWLSPEADPETFTLPPCHSRFLQSSPAGPKGDPAEEAAHWLGPPLLPSGEGVPAGGSPFYPQSS